LSFYRSQNSAVDSEGAGGARAPPEFGGSEKWGSLIFAYRSLAITTNTPGFKKLSTALQNVLGWSNFFVADQKFIYILWQSLTFCARQEDDLHS